MLHEFITKAPRRDPRAYFREAHRRPAGASRDRRGFAGAAIPLFLEQLVTTLRAQSDPETVGEVRDRKAWR